jgi:hypothetical protein
MALAQVVNIYFDTTKYGSAGSLLLQGLTSPATLSSVGMIGGDIFTLNLWPRATSQAQGAATTTVQLANPSEMGFTGKITGYLSASTTLFEAFGFTELQDGNGNYYYQAILSLNTDELVGVSDGALNGKSLLLVTGEIENFGALIGGVTQEQRLQFPIIVYPPVYTGTEGSPTPSSPGYYNTTQSDARYMPLVPAIGSFEAVVDEGDGTQTLRFKLWNVDQGKFQTVYLRGAASVEELVISSS